MSERNDSDAREIQALEAELDHVRAERVQLETLAAQRADEIHKLEKQIADQSSSNGGLRTANQQLRADIKRLNNRLTVCQLERDALKHETSAFDQYPVGTLFQKKEDGRVLAMTLDGNTHQAIAPKEQP